MKSRFFVMLLTALLMGSISASAQDSGTPVKGDVNGDGAVNAADIVEIVNIMMGRDGGTSEEVKYYWYVGTTKPTSLSEATIVTSYPAEQTFTLPELCCVYVLTTIDKTVKIIDPIGIAHTTAEDTTTISGYKITYPSADGSTPYDKLRPGVTVTIKIY